ncbi:methyl-CpG-binding domain protein 3-like 1 [Saccopteryx bilineata]|uniref:methyl-CpG-binding domain protein 3-like 1 n=1 Tax=Saccopteryx bilineata TaxID=59482 RepID=UPI00338ECE09
MIWKKPQQVCAYKALRDLQPYSTEGEPLSIFYVINAMKIMAAEYARESLGCTGPGSLSINPEPSTAGSSKWAAMIPGAGRSVPRLSCRQLVTVKDAWTQTQEVKNIKEKLAVALKADDLSREAEMAKSQEGCHEN